MKSFSGTIIVSNYPMKNRNDEEMEKLNSCTERRKVEIIESQLRKDILPPDLAVHPPLVGECLIVKSTHWAEVPIIVPNNPFCLSLTPIDQHA